MTGDPTDAGDQSRLLVVVLRTSQARRREPSATVWTLMSYDAASRTPVADIAQRWHPAPLAPASRPVVPTAVTEWAATVLGPGAVVGDRADAFAGPGSWHIRAKPVEAQKP